MTDAVSATQNKEKSKRFIGVEYEGRSVAIRRSTNYDVTIILIKESFRALRSVSTARIAISSFIAELDETLEVSKNIWSEVIPDLKRITVTLDSPCFDENTSGLPRYLADDQPSLRATTTSPTSVFVGSLFAQSQPHTARQVGDFASITLPKTPWTSFTQSSDSSDIPSTLPRQISTWGKDQRHTLLARYSPAGGGFKTVQGVITSPSTTIADLKEFVKSRCPFKTFTKMEYFYLDASIDDKLYVSELGLQGNQANYLEVRLAFD